MRLLKLTGLLFVLLFALFWPFYANNFAIEKNNSFRALANGWVSLYANIHLREDLSVTQKIKQTVSADLVHGRFRPAFFFYVTSSYALSPLVHGRSVDEEGRSYRKLMNGDLRLFSTIVLATLGMSFVLMSLLIYKYTNEFVFSLIPIFFIPLSQTVTSNLFSGTIDSQEIPVILCLAAWIFFFFTAMIIRKKLYGILCVVLSLIFLIFAFLIKETVIITSVGLFIIFMCYIYTKKISPQNVRSNNSLLLLISLTVSLICSSLVLFMVFKYRQGYGASYSIGKYEEIKRAAELLWIWLSEYSLHNIYGYIPIFLFVGIAVKERNKTLLNIPIIQHSSLVVINLLFCYGFLFVLIPWKPLGPKYVFPSVFFFSFAVALSLSLLAAWAKERYNQKGLLVYLFLLVYIVLYTSYAEKSDQAKSYAAEKSNYGVSIAYPLADNIADEFFSSKIKRQRIFVDYGTNVSWANTIPFGWLHLMRILNLEKNINLMDRKGNQIFNYHMPTAELSSFREYKDNKKVYISRNPKELISERFDVIYKGYKSSEEPLKELSFSKVGAYYKRSGECIHYQSDTKSFPEFFICKYVSF
ncbi:hypothetical protein KKHLCK_15405 [Candidatus Electrothrix laxa]